MTTEQINKGSGNINTSNSNNNFSFVINLNGSTESVEISELFDTIAEKCCQVDEEINNLLSNKVLMNKTNSEEKYKTGKIITSLFQLGFPPEVSYKVVQETIEKIKEFLISKSETNRLLTTKDIRKMVLNSIQGLDTKKFKYSDIEKWSSQYIRRYGHNNRIIEIYYSNNDKIHDISYEYIKKKLLKEIVFEVTKGKLSIETINSSNIETMATEILDFVNNCDLYKINHDVLKNFIKEIATQQPHPWFINEKTRDDIMAYDYDCLLTNIDKLKTIINNKSVITETIKIEILHHASALVLEKYNYFLGSYDLASFFLLKDLLNSIYQPKSVDNTKANLMLDYSKWGSILSDFAFANVNICEFLNVMNQINTYLDKEPPEELSIEKIYLTFAKLCKQVYELGKKTEVENFLKSNWEDISLDLVIYNLKLVFYSLFPVKKWNLKALQNHFWLHYNRIPLKNYETTKNQIFVVYNDGKIKDYNFLSSLNSARTQNVCNTIIVIGHDDDTTNSTYDIINEYCRENNLTRLYTSISLNKDHIIKLFDAKDKINCFDELVLEQISVDDD